MQPTLSTASIVITVLAFLVGLLNVAVQTGKILNQWPVPAKLGPYLVVLGSFFGGAYANMQSQPALVINGTTIFFAFFAGLSTLLVGATPGLASHLFGAAVNVKRPAPVPAEVAAVDNATKPPGAPGGVGGAAVIALLCIVLPALGIAGLAGLTGCTPEAKSAIDKGLDSAPLVCAATLEVEQLLNLDEGATKTVCNVVEETAPAVKQAFDDIVGAKKAAARKMGASGARPPCK